MVNLPNCDQCGHEEICKITKELITFRNRLDELKLVDDIPNGVSIDLDCSYYKHEITDYVC